MNINTIWFVVQTILIIFKATGDITASWFVVFLPTILYMSVFILLLFMMLGMALIVKAKTDEIADALIDKMEEQEMKDEARKAFNKEKDAKSRRDH